MVVGDISFVPPQIRTLTPIFKTLDIPYQGVPFMEGRTDPEMAFFGLDWPSLGGPFAPTLVTFSNQSLVAAKGYAYAQGRVLSVGKGVPATPGSVVAQGQAKSVRQASGALVPLPGRLDVSGSFAGFRAAMLPVSVGLITGSEIAGLRSFGLIVSPPAMVEVQAGPGLSVRGFQGADVWQRSYECWISGPGNIPQLFPMSSFQARKRVAEPSFATVTLPGIQRVEGVLLQAGLGTFSVVLCAVAGGVVWQREVLFTAPLASVVVTGNADEQNIVLSGYWIDPERENPQYLALSGVSYRMNYAGMETLRSPVVDLYLQPGDFASFDGETLAVESISYSLSPIYGASMDIRGTVS
jgi:hypothetical protein